MFNVCVETAREKAIHRQLDYARHSQRYWRGHSIRCRGVPPVHYEVRLPDLSSNHSALTLVPLELDESPEGATSIACARDAGLDETQHRVDAASEHERSHDIRCGR